MMKIRVSACIQVLQMVVIFKECHIIFAYKIGTMVVCTILLINTVTLIKITQIHQRNVKRYILAIQLYNNKP